MRTSHHEDGDSPRRRRHPESTPSDIPFRDADTTIGEVPLDELDTFVVPGTDDRGNGEHMQLRMPPFIRRQIKVVLSSGRFPYLTEASFIRHAVVRHLAWLVSIRHSIPKHIIPALAAMLEVYRDDEMRIQVEEVLEKIDRRISFHLGRGDHMEVVRLLNLVKGRMVGVQDSSWLRHFWDHFEQKWAGYLKPVPAGDKPHRPS